MMKITEKMAIILVVGALVVATAGIQAACAGDTHSLGSSVKDFDLSTAEVANLEDNVEKNPRDMDSRSSLIMYYFMKERGLDIRQNPSAFKAWFMIVKNYVLTKIGLNSAAKLRKRHVLWMIRNHPEAEIVGTPFAQFMPFFDRKAYDEGKEAWLHQVEIHTSNPIVLGHAAQYFLFADSNISEDLLKKAQAMEPKNPRWSEELGRLYALRMFTSPTEKRKEIAAQSLLQSEKAYRMSTDKAERFYMLSDIAHAAFGAGEFKKADSYAGELLALAPLYKNDWNYGNAVFEGNMILGRLALRANDIARAKSYLLEAGRTPGSPQLDSFGPNMILARELLERGERDAVIEFFNLCSKFWKMDRGALAEWVTTVKKSGMVDFGQHAHE